MCCFFLVCLFSSLIGVHSSSPDSLHFSLSQKRILLLLSDCLIMLVLFVTPLPLFQLVRIRLSTVFLALFS